MPFLLPLVSISILSTIGPSLHSPARRFSWTIITQLSSLHLRDDAPIFVVNGAAVSALAGTSSEVAMEHATSVHIYNTTEVTDPAPEVLPKR